MPMQEIRFQIYDVSSFPLVIGRAEAMRPGYASQWCDEMRALVGQERPFVLIHDAHGEEDHEDRRQRALWLKQHKAALGRCCKALIHVEPDTVKRAALEAMAKVAVKAFGVPAAMAATLDEALALASYALAADSVNARANADAGAPDAATR